MSSFENLRIVDNFYQTSAFFPMPLTLIGTLDENGNTSYGAYSLIFPYYIAGKDYYAMVLECRNSSNTCKGILRTGKCTINFMPYTKKIFKECVRLGFPGDTPEEKMKEFKFTMIDGKSKEEHPEELFPKVIDEAYQVFECTWVKELDNAQNDQIQDEYNGPYHDFNGITSKFGAHFILKINKILMKEKYYFITYEDENTKKKRINLWQTIKQNGKFINSGYSGDYWISTYEYNNKIYDLAINDEYGIMSYIKEYEKNSVNEKKLTI